MTAASSTSFASELALTAVILAVSPAAVATAEEARSAYALVAAVSSVCCCFRRSAYLLASALESDEALAVSAVAAVFSALAAAASAAALALAIAASLAPF